jgi:ribosome recycling factor
LTHPSPIEGWLTTHSLRSILPSPTSQLFAFPKNFSQTPLHRKKKGKADREKADAISKASAEAEDPFDFSTLEAGIEKTLEKLKNDLSKLRTGGRFNPEILENVRVHLHKDSKASERLGDLAQVLPKGGRSVMVLVGEKDVSS